MPRAVLFFVAAAVPLLLYARTASFDFVRADDEDLIVGNQPFLSDLRNLPRAFERSYFEVEGELTTQKTYYRPVAIVSFMLDAARGGADARAYHVTNVILHAAATCLLLALALAWGAPPWAALAATLLFAVHPLNAQAVAWIAGRNDLLLAVFGLASLLAWSATASTVATVVHVIAFALALFSKEIGIFFPLLGVLHQRAVCHQRLTRWHWIALTGDAGVVIAWITLRARALEGMPSELSLDTLRTATINLPHLLAHGGKMLFPVRLNVSPGVDTPSLVTGAIAIAPFALWAWRAMPRGVAILIVCWPLAFLLPTLVVPGMPVYEHRAYLPLIGIVTCLAVGLAGRKAPPNTAVRAATVVVLIVFATLAYQRQDVFRDRFTYWTDATRDARFGPIAHVNLGQLHEAAGRPADARREYLRALERDPNTPKAHNNLGVVLMSLDEPELAFKHFGEETRRHPWNAEAWFNLGLWHELHNDRVAARKNYERAIAANPRYLPAHEKLGKPIGPAAREP